MYSHVGTHPRGYEHKARLPPKQSILGTPIAPVMYRTSGIVPSGVTWEKNVSRMSVCGDFRNVTSCMTGACRGFTTEVQEPV